MDRKRTLLYRPQSPRRKESAREVKTATVEELPDCQLCKTEGRKEPAEYDAKIPNVTWTYLCQEHFDKMGCKLGLGLGQKLVRPTKQPDELIQRADYLCEACGLACPEGSMNKETLRFRVLGDDLRISAVRTGMIACDEV